MEGAAVTALYPGTFDILTHGHLDIIRRAATLFDRLIVCVAQNEAKQPLFSPDERVQMLRDTVSELPNVEIMAFEGLTTAFAQSVGASVIVRGLRAVSDFEYELMMALMNRQLAPGIETVFLTASSDQIFLSSTLVREVGRLGGDIESFVPRPVAEVLRRKLAAQA
ncbi:MAG: pantetheine-phosphate adenylyltransferase [Candidatus Sumerlaeia bacterium]|nr:pantetheine-phosphate adenylyltransferase [Candidatus Sumerlaeia bacterium]